LGTARANTARAFATEKRWLQNIVLTSFDVYAILGRDFPTQLAEEETGDRAVGQNEGAFATPTVELTQDLPTQRGHLQEWRGGGGTLCSQRLVIMHFSSLGRNFPTRSLNSREAGGI
jgi:hypothetical protein